MKGSIYYKQAELLLRILPLVDAESVFALKGGTAINFFVRNLPRLSVDIDLTYIPINARAIALTDISNALTNISNKIGRIFPDSLISYKKDGSYDNLRALIVNTGGVTVKIESNLVIRGTLFEPEIMELSRKARDLFEVSINIRALSFPELYAGKICASLDRQHPRDIFDVLILLKNEGIDEKTRKAFIVHLISHPRPIVEILNPNFLDINHIFKNDFEGMTIEKISYEDILEARARLVSLLKSSLTVEEKKFLISVKKGIPEWPLLGLTGIENLPAIKWKLLNIKRMDKNKRKKALEKLVKYLED